MPTRPNEGDRPDGPGNDRLGEAAPVAAGAGAFRRYRSAPTAEPPIPLSALLEVADLRVTLRTARGPADAALTLRVVRLQRGHRAEEQRCVPLAAEERDRGVQLQRVWPDAPWPQLQHYPRYLKAIGVRLDKLKANPARDAQLLAEYGPLWTNYERRAIQLAKMGAVDPQLEQFRWLLEELRVGLYAQELRTPVPVSTKRLQKQWEGIKNG